MGLVYPAENRIWAWCSYIRFSSLAFLTLDTLSYMNMDSILKRWFADYANPTHKELELWMADPEAFEPMQDWDLVVGNESRLLSLVRLASNDGPQRDHIINYLHVATAVAFSSNRNRIIEGIKLVPEDTFPDLLMWREKATALLDNPVSFREKEWFCHSHNMV